MRITFILTLEDFERLAAQAARDYRKPPDQAAYYVATAVRRADGRAVVDAADAHEPT